MKRARWFLLPALLLLVLAGALLFVKGRYSSYRFVDSDQPHREGTLVAELAPGQPVGQTFVARHGGLAGFEIFLVPQGSLPVTLTLHLRTDPKATADLSTASLLLPTNAGSGFYRFTFIPIEKSHGEYYYAVLEAPEPGTSVALAEGASYLDGAAYQAHEPLDAQTAFRLAYEPGFMILDLLRAMIHWIGLLAVSGLLFVVPGWALLAWLLPERRLTWAELLGLAVGVSLALYALLLLWTDLVGLHLGALYAWLPVVFGLAALVWRYRTWRPSQGWDALQRWARSEALWPDVALLLLLSFTFGVRMLVVRTLETPMWGDGYQHTMIAQLLVDNDGLFSSWAPYAELESFTYHYGFHSTAAVLHWLIKMPVTEATLWTGQLLNGFAVLCLYPLAVRVTGSRWGGVCTVLLAGLLSPMPMFYVNWGRYTQLAGQVILPVAAWLTWESIERTQRHVRLLALGAMAAGGLALTHYRVLLFYGAFVVALIFLSLGREKIKETVIRLGMMALGAGILFLPWFVNAFQGYLLHTLGVQVTTLPKDAEPFVQAYNAIGRLETYLSPVWWLVLVVGIAIGLWNRQRGVLLVGLWWFLLLLAANPAWLSLPGTGTLSNFAVFIAVYLPAGIFVGVAVARVVRPALGYRWASSLLVLVAVILAMWGVRQRMSDVNPVRHALVTRPDVQAAAWIRENTPTEARFLINSFFAYGGHFVVGADGGWWLPLLAGRANTVPPLNYGSEQGPDSGYRSRVNELSQQVMDHAIDDPALIDSLLREGITHVYVGQRQGRVNYRGPDVLDPAELSKSPSYSLVYHRDRVWVFAIKLDE